MNAENTSTFTIEILDEDAEEEETGNQNAEAETAGL